MAKDLGAVFDAHVKAEFIDMDVAATMATMTPEPYLTHVPTLTGGTGRDEVERFYRDHCLHGLPAAPPQRADVELCVSVIQEAGVCVLAGTAFGGVGTNHIRISYANSRENLTEALRRIRSFIATGVAASA